MALIARSKFVKGHFEFLMTSFTAFVSNSTKAMYTLGFGIQAFNMVTIG